MVPGVTWLVPGATGVTDETGGDGGADDVDAGADGGAVVTGDGDGFAGAGAGDTCTGVPPWPVEKL
jgi:hypothetical protein